MKLRSIRGSNWVEASVSVTIVIENTTPTTVITAAASVVRIWRAPSAVPNPIHEGSVKLPPYAALSIACVPTYSATAAITSIVGTSQRFVRSASRRHSELSASGNVIGAEDRLARGSHGSGGADQAPPTGTDRNGPLPAAVGDWLR